MNGIYAGAAVVAVATALLSGAFAPRLDMDGGQGVDLMMVSAYDAQARPQDRFILSFSTGHESCAVTAAEGEETRRRLLLDAACAGLNAGLADARWWLERADGTVAFAREDGHVVAEFAMADGAAYESYAPRLPIMTLLAE